MGGTGNVAVLSAANRMELIAFAQMGNRLGGAIVLIISGFFNATVFIIKNERTAFLRLKANVRSFLFLVYRI